MTAGPSMTRSLLTSFLNLYEQDPDRILFTFVDDKGVDRQRLTVADLASQADAVACALPRWGLIPGDRALLVYPPSLDFVGAFLGCLAAGVLPVPVCPPDPLRLRHDVAAFTQIATDCGAGTVLTNSAYELARTAGNFTLFKATDGFPPVLRGDRHINLPLDDPHNGWNPRLLPNLTTVPIPGNHFTLLEQPHLTPLATAIRHVKLALSGSRYL